MSYNTHIYGVASEGRESLMNNANENLKKQLEVVQKQLDKSQRNTLLLDEKIKQAHQEWIAALDIMEDPIFIHDKNFYILRCNHAYQKLAGIAYDQIIGHPYFEIFPKTDEPIKNCASSIENCADTEDENILQIGDLNYRSRAYIVRNENQEYLYSVHILEDITEQIKIKNALQTSENQYRRLFESAKDGILILDGETGVIIDANPFILNLTTYTLSEITGKNLWDIGFIADISASKISFQELQKNDYTRYEDLPIKTKNGQLVNVEFVSNAYLVDNQRVIQCNIRDITEQMKSKQLLQESEEQFRRITTTAQDAIILINDEGNITYWNNAARYIFGYTRDEVMGKALHPLLAPERFHEAHYREFSKFIKTGKGAVIGKTTELMALKKDGTEFPIELSLSANMKEGKWGAIGIIRDISKRKQDEEGLKMFRMLLDHSSDAIEVLDAETLQYVDVNETAYFTLGYTRDELLLMNIRDIDVNISEDELIALAELLENVGSTIFESSHRRKDGSVFPVEISISVVQSDKEYVVSVVRDITERKRTDALICRSNRALKTLSAGNMTLVQAQSEDELLKGVTDVIVKEGGYSLVVVDYAQENLEKSIIPMAWSSLEEKDCLVKELSWSETAENQMPVSKAIRTGTTQITHNIAEESEFKVWRDAALARGYTASIALPLRDGGKVFGALNIYASEVYTFADEEEVRLLEELANDLAYGIITLRTRVAHEQHEIILRESLEQSIQTIAATVESRDPYTAGHQKHVSELATAIAIEMGLSKDQVNGIHLAAIIHDLGKIHIPAEILSKPGKLSKIEFMLIQTHPEAGYDILKNIKFPWPIADIILQHHEKIDGSGYPQGLKGDQILLEAKIIAVADVVEAISAHRPYRAALGIEVALEEIKQNRGTLYEASVVDACLKLFEGKRFMFSKHSFEAI